MFKTCLNRGYLHSVGRFYSALKQGMLLNNRTRGNHAKAQRGALAVAKNVVTRLLIAGVSPAEVTRIMRTLRGTAAATSDDQGLNHTIAQLLHKAMCELSLPRFQRSLPLLGENISAFTASHVPEAMAWEIVHNNPLVVMLSPQDITRICQELHQSGVDVGDFASIIAQHSPQCREEPI
ncbi:GTPase activating protein, putative [Babesia ovis]|uniref:GTPase activating protein, putative n=1 Tax=Babesia ovis TaxID=5869 RepID=A0A9W5T889_BABOV|nr:GTPase activating protein, putative [Babesia ovis]